MTSDLTFDAGTLTQTVEISTTSDTVLEMSESFTVSLSQTPVDAAVTLVPESTTINIQDTTCKLAKGSSHCLSPLHNCVSSSAVTIGFDATTYNVTEGGSVNVSVSVQSGTLARDVVVTLQTVNGTATGRVISRLVMKFHTISVPFWCFVPQTVATKQLEFKSWLVLYNIKECYHNK